MSQEIKRAKCEFCGMWFSEANPDMGSWANQSHHYHFGCMHPIAILEIEWDGDNYEVVYIVHHPEDTETPYYAERFRNYELRDITATDTVKETYRHARSMVRGARRYRTATNTLGL